MPQASLQPYLDPWSWVSWCNIYNQSNTILGTSTIFTNPLLTQEETSSFLTFDHVVRSELQGSIPTLGVQPSAYRYLYQAASVRPRSAVGHLLRERHGHLGGHLHLFDRGHWSRGGEHRTQSLSLQFVGHALLLGRRGQKLF